MDGSKLSNIDYIYDATKIILNTRWMYYTAASLVIGLIAAPVANPLLTSCALIACLICLALLEASYRLYTSTEAYQLKKTFRAFSHDGSYSTTELLDAAKTKEEIE